MANYGPISNNGIIGSGTKISTGDIGTLRIECSYPVRAALFRGSSTSPSYAGVSCLVYSLSDTTQGSSTSYVKDDNNGIYASSISSATPQYGSATVLNISNDYSPEHYDWANFNWEYDIFETQNEAFEFLDNYVPVEMYPITYHATNGTVAGPPEAAVGETVVATGTPNANYGITDYTTQISVTCNDIPVPFTFNATTNEITFEMPDPTSS